MPIYAYRCEDCGHAQDFLQKMSDPPIAVCPNCGSSNFKKQLTAAGFQLKGGGWYVTDFRDSGKKDGKKADSKPAETKSGEGKSDSGAKSDSSSSSTAASTPASTSPSASSSSTSSGSSGSGSASGGAKAD